MLNDQIILTYENLVLAPGRKALSGTIRAGEITGLAGLEGHGRAVSAGACRLQSASSFEGRNRHPVR